MTTFAAVMTGQGTGAISTIQVLGSGAQNILEKIFTPAAISVPIFETGKVLLGTIESRGKTIDQVTVGCEGPDNFAIHCHGNPLIVSDIMKLLGQSGAELITTNQFRLKIAARRQNDNTIALEAKLALPKAKTIQGAKIIANQVASGLTAAANRWLKDIETQSLGDIKAQCQTILAQSQPAKLIIAGITIVLAGPPNSGKSTLLNCLSGKSKAIVTDIKGTTRDWVTGRCTIGPLAVELIDTAGLDDDLGESIEKRSQQRSLDMLKKANLVLFVLDAGEKTEQIDSSLIEKTAGRKVLTVFNKSDLPVKLDTALSDCVLISAKTGQEIENLKDKILTILGLADFDLKTAIAFTDRQVQLLHKLISAPSTDQAFSTITELLNARLSV